MSGKISIVGLGPGSADALTSGALTRLKSGGKVYLRTGKHPVAAALVRQGIVFSTFDEYYERAATFAEVYTGIAATVINYAREEKHVVYGVPGHPLVGEGSVRLILEEAKVLGIAVDLIPGLSFLDILLTRLELNPAAGLKVLDALTLDGDKPDPAVPTVVMQVYNRDVASHVKLTLMEYYPNEHPVTVIRAAGIPGEETIVSVPLCELDRLPGIEHLTSVYVPVLTGKACHAPYDLRPLVEVMGVLRAPGGCPWDRVQTHKTLKRYIVEEVYEVLEAIELGDADKLCEELGDLLLQIVFHARIAEEVGDFTIDDVIAGVTEKMVRRHPHVFAAAVATTPEQVVTNWEAIKKLEAAAQNRRSQLDGIPAGLPALMRAFKLQARAAKIGFDWEDMAGVWDKIQEEIQELQAACQGKQPESVEEELGDLLFAIVNLARFAGVEPETALTRTNNKFIRRFQMMEKMAAAEGKQLSSLHIIELEALWQRAKHADAAKNL